MSLVLALWAGPRHRLGVRRPRIHVGPNFFYFFYEGGVYRNIWFMWGLYSKVHLMALNIDIMKSWTLVYLCFRPF